MGGRGEVNQRDEYREKSTAKIHTHVIFTFAIHIYVMQHLCYSFYFSNKKVVKSFRFADG
jgi:hypothetical protein